MGTAVIRIRDWGADKKIWKYLAIISMFVFVVLSVCSFFYIRELNVKTNKITSENVVNNVTLNDYTTKINNENMKHLEKIFNSTFTADQLAAMAAKNYTYVLTVNGKVIDKTNETYVNSSEITIGLTESIAENKLPTNILKMGRIAPVPENGDDYASNITISAKDRKFVKSVSEKNGVTTVKFTCGELKVGDIVTVFFSDELKKRMGLSDNYLEIFYNK